MPEEAEMFNVIQTTNLESETIYTGTFDQCADMVAFWANFYRTHNFQVGKWCNSGILITGLSMWLEIVEVDEQTTDEQTPVVETFTQSGARFTRETIRLENGDYTLTVTKLDTGMQAIRITSYDLIEWATDKLVAAIFALEA